MPMTEQDRIDIAWLMSNAAPDVLATDLDRFEGALKLIFQLDSTVDHIPRKNIALRRAYDVIQYLRVANDIE